MRRKLFHSRVYGQLLNAAQTVLSSTFSIITSFQDPAQSSQQHQMKALRPTAWLDGLRGFAALLVYVLHHELWAHESLQGERIFENAYGYEGRHYFVQLPFIRVLFGGGHYSVAIFFVISGYVLSLKPMTLLQDQRHLEMCENLASALFRRWLRLYILVAVTTFMFMLCLSIYPPLQTVVKPEAHFLDEVYRWYDDFKGFSFVFRQGGVPWSHYNFHAWTIPFEFKGSIIVYTTVLALFRCTRNARLSIEAFLVFYFMYIVDGWYASCFMAGLLLVDLHLLAERHDLPEWISKLAPYKTILSYIFLTIGVYLGGAPAFGSDIEPYRNSFGWHYLSYLKPSAVFTPKAFYLFWGGLFTVASIPNVPYLKAFFELRPIQYLGKVSYAFYLCHGPVLWTIGDRTYAAVGWIRSNHAAQYPFWVNLLKLPAWGPVGLEFNFLVAQLLLLPTTLWLAGMVTRAIDEPILKVLGQGYRSLCTEKPREGIEMSQA